MPLVRRSRSLETIPPGMARVREEVSSPMSALTRTAIPSGNTPTAAVLTPVTSDPTGDETPEGDKVYTYLTACLRFEMFCLFGCLLYLDVFLSLVVYLPLRIVRAVWHWLKYKFDRQGCRLQPTQVWDLLKGGLFFLLLFGMNDETFETCVREKLNITDCEIWKVCFQPAVVVDFWKDMGVFLLRFRLSFETLVCAFYMVEKGLADIKLWTIYTALDLADRLLAGVGQDLLDSLYRTATEPGRKNCFRISSCFYFIFALLCIALQTFLIICQMVVLMLVFENNTTVRTIIISTSIAEIKQIKSKGMNKNNLLQASCSDVRELFHMILLLLFVLIAEPRKVGERIQTALYIILLEIVVDCVKHTFITKFSEMPAETYRTFTVNLAQDISTFNNKNELFADYSDLVSRRMGLTPIPLVCCLVIVFIQFLKHYDCFAYGLISVVLILILMKLLTFFLLPWWCEHLLKGAQEQGHQTDPCDIDSKVHTEKKMK